MSALFFAVVLIGFSRSFYLKSYFDFPALPVHLYLHGIALTSWFALVLFQPWLIRNQRAGLHRKLGVIGAALAICVVSTGVWTVVMRDAPEIDQYPTRAAGNLASLLMFSSCVCFGLLFRKESETHKRLMSLASLSFLSLLLAVVTNDLLTRRRVNKGTVIGLLSIFIVAPAVTFLLISSGLWLQVVGWVA